MEQRVSLITLGVADLDPGFPIDDQGNRTIPA